MSEAMLVVIAYDTPDARRRQQIVRLLENVADRVQWSVFEGWLTEEQIDKVWHRLEKVVDPNEDELRLYRVCAYCRDASRALGQATLSVIPDHWVV